MLIRILGHTLRRRIRRVLATALAVTTGASLAAALLGISLDISGDISGQVGQRLRAYGANIIIRPAGQVPAGGSEMPLGNPAAVSTMAEADLARAREVAGVIGVVPYLHALVEVSERPVVLAGVDVLAARSLNAWWRVEGRWPEATDEVLAGIRAAAALELASGNTFQVEYGGTLQTLRVVGTLDTGGAEDDQLIAGLLAVHTLIVVTHDANVGRLADRWMVLTVVSLIFRAVSANWLTAMAPACRQDGETDMETSLGSPFKAESGHWASNTRPMRTRNWLFVIDQCVTDNQAQFKHTNAVRDCGIN